MGASGMYAIVAALALLALLRGTHALRTEGTFNYTLPEPKERETTVDGLPVDGYRVDRGQFDYYHSTFAFTGEGEFILSFNAAGRNGSQVYLASDVSSCFRLVLCDMTKDVVRDYAYQMRRVLFHDKFFKSISRDVCGMKGLDVGCTRQLLPIRGKTKTYQPAKNRSIVYVRLLACASCLDKNAVKGAQVNYSIEMVNPDLRFPQLGWDETVYPFAPTVFVSFALLIIAFASFGVALTMYREFDVPFVSKVVFCTAALKIFSTSLTTAAYWHIALTGRVMVWFFVLRVPLIIADEIAIGLLMLVMSTGVGLMPATWMFDRRSSTFAVFLGLALEVFTVVTSEVLFMFRFLGLIVFLFSGGTVAFICVLYSWRNARFLAKYANLVQHANIHVSTTPLPRMALFFQVNAMIVIAVWLFKVVSFGVMDHVLKRSDMLWVLFEAADIVLLSWYAFSVFPRRKSAYYVDMANVNNDRLREVSSWRLRHGPHAIENDSDLDMHDDEIVDVVGNVRRINSTAANADDATRDEAVNHDPEPPMIEWQSGDPLPSPNAGMWNMQEEMRRVWKRAKPPAAAPVRVLGSPSVDHGDSLSLAVARPVLGPGTRKKEDRSSVIRTPQYADRQRPRVADDGVTTTSGFQSRELSAVSDFEYEPFSIPSSNASGDGVVFVAEKDGKDVVVGIERSEVEGDDIAVRDDDVEGIVARTGADGDGSRERDGKDVGDGPAEPPR